jgi:hypothetical protein
MMPASLGTPLVGCHTPAPASTAATDPEQSNPICRPLWPGPLMPMLAMPASACPPPYTYGKSPAVTRFAASVSAFTTDIRPPADSIANEPRAAAITVPEACASIGWDPVEPPAGPPAAAGGAANALEDSTSVPTTAQTMDASRLIDSLHRPGWRRSLRSALRPSDARPHRAG